MTLDIDSIHAIMRLRGTLTEREMTMVTKDNLVGEYVLIHSEVAKSEESSVGIVIGQQHYGEYDVVVVAKWSWEGVPKGMDVSAPHYNLRPCENRIYWTTRNSVVCLPDFKPPE